MLARPQQERLVVLKELGFDNLYCSAGLFLPIQALQVTRLANQLHPSWRRTGDVDAVLGISSHHAGLLVGADTVKSVKQSLESPT